MVQRHVNISGKDHYEKSNQTVSGNPTQPGYKHTNSTGNLAYPTDIDQQQGMRQIRRHNMHVCLWTYEVQRSTNHEEKRKQDAKYCHNLLKKKFPTPV